MVQLLACHTPCRLVAESLPAAELTACTSWQGCPELQLQGVQSVLHSAHG